MSTFRDGDHGEALIAGYYGPSYVRVSREYHPYDGRLFQDGRYLNVEVKYNNLDKPTFPCELYQDTRFPQEPKFLADYLRFDCVDWFITIDGSRNMAFVYDCHKLREYVLANQHRSRISTWGNNPRLLDIPWETPEAGYLHKFSLEGVQPAKKLVNHYNARNVLPKYLDAWRSEQEAKRRSPKQPPQKGNPLAAGNPIARGKRSII